jgi:hypothetical protein
MQAMLIGGPLDKPVREISIVILRTPSPARRTKSRWPVTVARPGIEDEHQFLPSLAAVALRV